MITMPAQNGFVWARRKSIVAVIVGTAGSTQMVTPAHATVRADAAWRLAQEVSPFDEARALFREGVGLYDMSNYTEALDRFSKAYLISRDIEDEAMRAKVLHGLQFNLARAHVRSFEIDKDSKHLRIASDLLDKYIGNDAGLTVDKEAESLQVQVAALLAEAEAALAEAEAEARRETQASSQNEGSESSTDDAADEGDADDGTFVPRDAPTPKKAKLLLISGYSSLGMAGASLGLMAVGFSQADTAQDDLKAAATGTAADRADSKGKTGNLLGAIGIAGAAAFAAVGTTLVVLGMKKKKEARDEPAFTRVQWAPLVGGEVTGLSLGGKF